MTAAPLPRLPATRGKVMTSVELDPKLLQVAKNYARTQGITLRALIEEALRERLARKGGQAMASR